MQESEIRKQFESEVSTLQTEYAQKEQDMARRLADAEVKAKQKLSGYYYSS